MKTWHEILINESIAEVMDYRVPQLKKIYTVRYIHVLHVSTNPAFEKSSFKNRNLKTYLLTCNNEMERLFESHLTMGTDCIAIMITLMFFRSLWFALLGFGFTDNHAELNI